MTTPGLSHYEELAKKTSDAKIRADIRAILALPPDQKSAQGSTPRFVQGSLRQRYGPDGSKFPDSQATRLSQAANILALVDQWVKKTTPTLPPQDPGEAIPGPGPLPNPLNGITSILSFLGKLADPAFLLRIGEFILGVMLIGVGAAKLSDSVQDTIIKVLPATKALVK
jgi:hypothetical protein